MQQHHHRPAGDRPGTQQLDHIPAAGGEAAETTSVAAASNERFAELERELQQVKENLQATIEELQTTNEEQQATNEELMAANEELQSTNEELQSTNEELYTVNTEYQSKIQELSELNTDIDNLLRSTDIGTLFLDRNLLIRKFTPAARDVIKVREGDIGRPIDDISTTISGVALAELARDVNNGIAKIAAETALLNYTRTVELHAKQLESQRNLELATLSRDSTSAELKSAAAALKRTGPASEDMLSQHQR